MIKKLKIEIRPTDTHHLAIHASEKIGFACAECHNKYYQFHAYCPQCLGEVRASRSDQRTLSVVSISNTNRSNLEQLLARLSEQKEFPFEKALETLPWMMLSGIDSWIVAEWKVVMEAENVQMEDQAFDPKKKRKFRSARPLFEKDGRLPSFLTSATVNGVRGVAKGIKNPGIRLKWVDTILTCHRILEGFYKREPARRILFSDFLFKLEAGLQECVKRYGSYFHNHEEEFADQSLKLKSEFEGMEAEMEAVRRQVEEQL